MAFAVILLFFSPFLSSSVPSKCSVETVTALMGCVPDSVEPTVRFGERGVEFLLSEARAVVAVRFFR